VRRELPKAASPTIAGPSWNGVVPVDLENLDFMFFCDFLKLLKNMSAIFVVALFTNTNFFLSSSVFPLQFNHRAVKYPWSINLNCSSSI
jgi:hypothetical protein